MKIKIIGIGSYIPNKEVSNTDFDKHVFLNEDGTPFGYPNEVVIKKFKGITGIENRRYAETQHNASDLAFFAAEKAIENSGIDRETLDYIIFAHNFGDVKSGTHQTDILPSLATRVKINWTSKIQNVWLTIFSSDARDGLKVFFKPMHLSNPEWQKEF
jgi:3-oxoacyl-[acyl-carrier-protein] synthase-3